MEILRPPARNWRPVAVAAAISAAVHAGALVGLRLPDVEEQDLEAPVLEATLVAAPAVEVAPAPAPAKAAPKPRPRPRPSPPRPDETVALLPDLPPPPPPEPIAPLSRFEPEPPPEMVALARPPAPPPPELPAFDAGALPGNVRITYSLTSAFADGEAEYTWTREGDRYEITGWAQAVGFFTLFLEGQISQRASGHVTARGLRPESFTERRGTTAEEGLAFDWAAREVEFRRGDQHRTAPLEESTVDWLSMIFQLAHMPPRGESVPLQVYTQRRLYRYRLQVVGQENVELPLGTVRALHLRHEGGKPEEVVDVWLGVDQHFLPVKLRYPVARNRLVVEQVATSIEAR